MHNRVHLHLTSSTSFASPKHPKRSSPSHTQKNRPPPSAQPWNTQSSAPPRTPSTPSPSIPSPPSPPCRGDVHPQQPRRLASSFWWLQEGRMRFERRDLRRRQRGARPSIWELVWKGYGTGGMGTGWWWWYKGRARESATSRLRCRGLRRTCRRMGACRLRLERTRGRSLRGRSAGLRRFPLQGSESEAETGVWEGVRGRFACRCCWGRSGSLVSSRMLAGHGWLRGGMWRIRSWLRPRSRRVGAAGESPGLRREW